jgi:hypothetical protein
MLERVDGVGKNCTVPWAKAPVASAHNPSIAASFFILMYDCGLVVDYSVLN